MAETEVDVFICGAGPVGLLLAYQLRRFGHSVYIIDRDDKAACGYPMYGRACTLYAGTLEILDRLDLLDDFVQGGFASSQARQWQDGKLINSDAGIFADPEVNEMSTPFMPAMLNLRLKRDNATFNVAARYTLSRELLQKYGYKLTAEQAITEAKNAMATHCTFECKQLHWHTVYSVQQYVAARFLDQERVLLAGDAGLTHSSALAQGMNAGVHNATNMAWKLSGMLKGMYKPDVLATYEIERCPVAQRLVQNDKILARLISDKTAGSLEKWIETGRDNASWAVGLAIVYDRNVLNQYPTSRVCKIKPGRRVYGAQLQKPSMLGSPTRLNELQKNNGRFIIMVLAGDPSLPGIAQRLERLREQVDEAGFWKDLVDFMTIR